MGRLPLYFSFEYRDQAFWGCFFGLHPLVLLGGWLLQVQIWDIWGKQKIWRTHHYVIPRVLESLPCLFPSLQLSKSSFLCYTQNQVFLLCLMVGTGKNMFVPSFWKWNYKPFEGNIWEYILDQWLKMFFKEKFKILKIKLLIQLKTRILGHKNKVIKWKTNLQSQI